MKITILNGDMKLSNSGFSNYIETLAEEFRKNNSVDLFTLHEMNLQYCTGCWSCWLKTPGRCALNDEAETILKSAINSDFVIFASPVMAGFTSSSLKKITDRFVGLIHPYILLKNGECHHKKRYDKYPRIGLVLEKEPDTDNEDIEIINNIYNRLAINMHSVNKYIKFIHNNTIEDIIYETCNN